MSNVPKFCTYHKFKTDFHSKMSVYRHELGGGFNPQPPANSNSALTTVQEYVFYVFQNPKTRLFTFFETSCEKRRKLLSKFSLFSALKLLTLSM